MTFKFTNLKTIIILASALVCLNNDTFGQAGNSVTVNGGACTNNTDVTLPYQTSTGTPTRHVYNDGTYRLEGNSSGWFLTKMVLVQIPGPPGFPPMFVPSFSNVAYSSGASAPNPTTLTGGSWSVGSGCTLSKLEGSGTQAPAALPVTFVSFQGGASNNVIKLNWTTASEVNNSHFDIERSVDGINFTSIDKVNGNGTTELVKEYTTLDKSPIAGINYYRLKQVDYDGQSSYSDIISVSYDSDDLFTANIYPNPASSEINIHVKKETSIVISDINGRIVKKTIVDAINNNISISDLNAGMYMVKIGNQTGTKLVKE